MIEQQAALYIVATPIGNLLDMSMRAVDVLKSVSLIAAEDTRHSAVLLQHFGITTKMVSYHDFASTRSAEKLLEKVRSGLSVALISDAGTPLISDPGYKLVNLARQEDLKVVPIPGACAITAAISVAGLPSDKFIFEGFLPNKMAARQAQLRSVLLETRTLIFYESPHRIIASLEDFNTVFGGQRKLFIAREISKKFETLTLKSLEECLKFVSADANQQRGEFVLILEGADKDGVVDSKHNEALAMVGLLLEDLSMKRAVAVAAKITGAKKNKLYEEVLARHKSSS
ncbi:MAG: 16S rRNA (cytidine(1402)-2'-O)-methyltransferase [SAR86 cluster bacterium]|uniref:Ribosomal RNA small subunit methyltransferase I n=1 Tax=SAR86 cluster bacterium TaxID=2030880 RepID=A0A2A4MSF9_9GAMM|nr:MAG: 16S rRNA (cytidine(1402)-2'-O)-methyltransferase [SAR86 cluster bacterium]